ncbi:hypothetical protein JX265_003434 [Neoarthrinium moseri]|uniref:Uncharacterized protein n=1 Tax=Neoarthrinium moseri TaxID=1658444 RepID=A0A9P9WS63_9PEZI|nr:hypothetical protein JX266_004439 [Neoarthrinium moseri]KAI1877426.1 hypothetical protein JX265_003434 [Neoarthrinium moseri]
MCFEIWSSAGARTLAARPITSTFVSTKSMSHILLVSQSKAHQPHRDVQPVEKRCSAPAIRRANRAEPHWAGVASCMMRPDRASTRQPEPPTSKCKYSRADIKGPARRNKLNIKDVPSRRGINGKSHWLTWIPCNTPWHLTVNEVSFAQGVKLDFWVVSRSEVVKSKEVRLKSSGLSEPVLLRHIDGAPVVYLEP